MKATSEGWSRRTPGAIDVAHFDTAWTSGLTEGRKVAALADTFDRPIAPHDCTGPVLLVANTYPLFATENALILESVRAHYRTCYQDLVTTLPRIGDGCTHPLDGPGLGTELLPKLHRRTDVAIRRSDAAWLRRTLPSADRRGSRVAST